VITSHPAAGDTPPVAGLDQPDEVTQLKTELAATRAQLDRRQARRTALRRAGLTLLLVLGCGLVALSLIAAYVRATVLDTDRYVQTMAPIAESADVQRAVAQKLDAAIAERVDYAGLMREALPDRADTLAPALGSTLQNAVRSQIDRFVASDAFQQLWTEANRRVHSRVVALLTTGESGNVRLEGNTVFLDVSGAVERVRQGLQERGMDRIATAIPSSVDGRITLIQSEGFVKARDAVDLLERLTILLPILALLCLAGHIALSRPRTRGLLRVGLGLIVTALLLLAVVGLGRSAYLDAIDQEVLPRQAAADIFDALIGLLRAGLRVVAIVAIVAVVVALVTGRRGQIAAGARTAWSGLAAGRGFGWVAEHKALLQWTVAGLGAIVLLAWDPPTARVVLLDAALVVAAVALIAAIARAGGGVTRTWTGPEPGGARPAAPESSSTAP
jgi:hypothetical protein